MEAWIQVIIGLCTFIPLHEALHWLPARILGLKVTFGLDRFRGIPLMLATSADVPTAPLTLLMILKMVTFAFTPLLLIPGAYLLAILGLFRTGVIWIFLSALNLVVIELPKFLYNLAKLEKGIP